MRAVALIALLWGCAIAQPAAQSSLASLLPSDSYTLSSGNDTAVLARNVFLGGTSLLVASSASADACVQQLCAAEPSCQAANWCPLQEGCDDGLGPLPYQGCRLLAAVNCTLAPEVVARLEGAQATTAGFPVRGSLRDYPGFAPRPGQEIVGEDLECSGGVVAGACALPSATSAALECTLNRACAAVVWYPNGTDGCSTGVAMLKRSHPSATNTRMVPGAFVLDQLESVPLQARYVLRQEATVVLPPADELAAAVEEYTADPQNSTAWLGCVVAPSALLAGDLTTVLDGIESAEDCCRACREVGLQQCNVFNWCSRPEGCSYTDLKYRMSLQHEQCELRWQYLTSVGWPPAVIAKGTAAGGFTAGGPTSVAGPPISGFKREFGSGLFGQPGTPCADSVQLDVLECVRSAPAPELGEQCMADPLCRAIIYKPVGFWSTSQPVGLFRQASGADKSLMVANPNALVYFKEAAAGAEAAPEDGLSAGAIAGIAVGALAVALGAAIAGWALLRRRHNGKPRGVSPSLGAKEEEGASEASTASKARAHSQPAANPFQAYKAATISSLSITPTPGSPAASGTTCVRTAGQLSSVVSASPFAARRAQMGAPSAPAFGSMSPPLSGMSSGGSGCSAPPAAVPGAAHSHQPESGELLPELLAFRAQEDGSGFLSSGSSGGGGMASGNAQSPSPTPSAPLVTASLPPALQDWVIPNGSIKVLRKPGTKEQWVVGSGASGTVYRASYQGETVALKEIDVGRSLEAQQAFVTEAMRMQLISRHPNVVSFFGMALDGSKGRLILEYCEGRDLYSVLQLRGADGQRLFGWYRLGCRVACDVARALAYLHSRGVVHMDVKSGNVLLSATGTAKLADVGVSRLQTHTFLSNVAMVGSFDWCAPEVLMGSHECSSAVDLFSFSVLMWELIAGERPHRGNLRAPRVPEECPQEAADLMQQCASLDPAQRPTAQQALDRLAALLERQQQQGGGGAPGGTPGGGS